jgi:hypothetical protein
MALRRNAPQASGNSEIISPGILRIYRRYILRAALDSKACLSEYGGKFKQAMWSAVN